MQPHYMISCHHDHDHHQMQLIGHRGGHHGTSGHRYNFSCNKLKKKQKLPLDGGCHAVTWSISSLWTFANCVLYHPFANCGHHRDHHDGYHHQNFSLLEFRKLLMEKRIKKLKVPFMRPGYHTAMWSSLQWMWSSWWPMAIAMANGHCHNFTIPDL